MIPPCQQGDGLPPLDGLKVIDLTRVLAEPLPTMLPGDVGASSRDSAGGP